MPSNTLIFKVKNKFLKSKKMKRVSLGFNIIYNLFVFSIFVVCFAGFIYLMADTWDKFKLEITTTGVR